MKPQKEDTKNISFLGRKRINQKDELFQANLIKQEDGTASCQIWYDTAAIYNNVSLDPNEIESDLVLDIFVLGKMDRHPLPVNGDVFSVVVNDIPEGATPELRLKIVASDEKNLGKIYAATAKKISFKAPNSDRGDDAGEVSKTFLKFEPSDQLQGRLVDVQWHQSHSDIFIRFDRDFHKKFSESALLPVAIYPELVRSVATHLLCRYDELADLEQSSMAYHWLRFIEDNLELPLSGEDRLWDPDNLEQLPEVIEDIVTKFMSKQFRDGKTFLEVFLNAN